jgi:hypothetical protein
LAAPTLNIIRLTSRAVDQLVAKQVVYAHNHVTIDDHRRLAKLCAVVLRRATTLSTLLKSISFGLIHQRLHDYDEELDTWTWHPCICTSLLADVLEQSRALEHVKTANAEFVFAGDARFRKALSESSSLRRLGITNCVGHCTTAMYRRMTADLRELEVHLDNDDVWGLGTTPFMASLRGLSASLEKLTLIAGDEPLDIDTSRAELMWPRVHTVELKCVWVSTPALFHAFPNLRNLWIEAFDFLLAVIPAASVPCWSSLDDARLPTAALGRLNLTSRIRRLIIISTLGSDAEALLISGDLHSVQPMVLDLAIRMAPAQRGVEETEVSRNHACGVTSSVAGDVMKDLPRLKTLKLGISAEGLTQTIEAVDEYMARLRLHPTGNRRSNISY